MLFGGHFFFLPDTASFPQNKNGDLYPITNMSKIIFKSVTDQIVCRLISESLTVTIT